jgi:hypothetical protein
VTTTNITIPPPVVVTIAPTTSVAG